jgi:hypothetical protein
MNKKQKGPQVLADLTGGIQITSNRSISQNELIRTLCDADMATTNLQNSRLRRFILVSNLMAM